MGLSGKFCDLACTCGGARRCHMLSNSCGKFTAGEEFVSGGWRSTRWCTVEVSSPRLGCGSVISVREKCDEKGIEGIEKYPVLSTQYPEKRHAAVIRYGSAFQRSRRVAEGHGSGDGNLQANRQLSETGGLQPYRSDPPRSGFGSEQHRRGAGAPQPS